MIGLMLKNLNHNNKSHNYRFLANRSLNAAVCKEANVKTN